MTLFSSIVDIPKVVRQPLKYSLILTGCITALSVSSLFFLPPQIPIFYSLPLTAQQISDRNWVLLFPGFSLLVTLLHIGLVGWLNKVDVEVIRLFGWLTVVLQVILFAILIRLLAMIV